MGTAFLLEDFDKGREGHLGSVHLVVNNTTLLSYFSHLSFISGFVRPAVIPMLIFKLLLKMLSGVNNEPKEYILLRDLGDTLPTPAISFLFLLCIVILLISLLMCILYHGENQ